MSPVPVPVLDVPGFGAGIEYFVPRVRYWKFFFKWTSMAGVEPSAVGEDAVTVVRNRAGFPQEGQNFFVEYLHILRIVRKSSHSEMQVEDLLEACMTA